MYCVVFINKGNERIMWLTKEEILSRRATNEVYYCPATDKYYDFWVDESYKVWDEDWLVFDENNCYIDELSCH